MKKKLLLIGIILSIVVFLFFKYGSKTYSPIVSKIKGKQTVNSIVEDYNSSVDKRLSPFLSKAGFIIYPEKVVF